jgi:hypothetical protein
LEKRRNGTSGTAIEEAEKAVAERNMRERLCGRATYSVVRSRSNPLHMRPYAYYLEGGKVAAGR